MTIKTYKKKAQTRGPHLMSILEDICTYYGKSPHAIIEEINNTTNEYTIIRRLYCYVAWKITNAPLKDIGALLERDHSYVISHRDIVEGWIKNGRTPWIDEWLDWLEWTTIWGMHEKLR